MSDLHVKIGRELDARRGELALTITNRHNELHPEREARYGIEGRKKCLEDASCHLRYLAEAVMASRPTLFTDYVGWAKVMLASRQIPAEDLVENLHVILGVLEAELDAEAGVVLQGYIGAALSQLPDLPVALPTALTEGSPVGDLDQRYMALLLKADRRGAGALILKAFEDGASVKDLYIHVFQKTQYEIGRLWQMNEISVAQEHFCTAATQLIMSQLYPHIFSSRKLGRRLVVACVGGDLHELGVRMVADFFEMEGWDTYYLGASTPAEGVIQSVIEHKAHLLGISATMTFHLQAVTDLIATLRNTPECATVKVLVGGYPFNVDPELWQIVGADGTASDAQDAIDVGEQLLRGDRL